MTWAGALGEGFGRKHAKALLSDPTKRISKQLKFCEDISLRKRVGQKVSNTAVLSLEALALVANERMKEVIGNNASLPEKACIQEVSSEGNAVVESYPSNPLIYGIVGKAVQGRVYLTESPELALLNNSQGPKYSFRRKFIDNEGKLNIDVLGLYDGIPSPRQLLIDYISVLNGETKVLGRYAEDDENNTTMKVFTEKKVDK